MSDTEEKRLLLKSAHLKGFKSIEDLTVEFRPGLNVLIGKNGSGKSNLLELIDQVFASLYNRASLTFKLANLEFISNNREEGFTYGVSRKLQKGSNAEDTLPEDLYLQFLRYGDELIFDTSDDNFKTQYYHKGRKIPVGRFVYQAFGRLGYPRPVVQYIKFGLPRNIIGLERPDVLRIPILHDLIEWEFDSELAFLHEAISNIQEAFSDQYYDKIQEDYSLNDAAVLSEMIGSLNIPYIMDRLKIDENVKNNLVLFSPIKDVRFHEGIGFFKDDSTITFDNIRLEFFVNGHWLPWGQLSDGTKRMFYIISEVTTGYSGVFLIEEPELGVHPGQFHLLMQFLKQESEYKQIIISTHAPKALDALNPDELDHIMIAHYDNQKGTQISRMTEEQVDKAKGYIENVGFLSDYWLMSDLEDD